MKKLRYLCLGITILFMMVFGAPSAMVFAETTANDRGDASQLVNKNNDAKDGILNGNDDLETNDGENEENDKDEEILRPNIVIYSYNPGFSEPYVGEFMELARLQPNSILLADLSIVYETSSGSEYVVLEFDETQEMVGESLLLRLMSSNEVKDAEDVSQVADVVYTRNMSQSAGRIKVKYGEEVIDSLCWGFKEAGCYEAFKTGKKNPPTTLVREIDEEEIGEFRFLENYTPTFDPLKPNLLTREIPEEVIEPQCRSLELTELYAYYETSTTEQFVEIYNNSDEDAKLDGCSIGYKGKYYYLSGNLEAKKFLAIYPFVEWGLTLTKNPTSANKLSLVDVNGESVDSLTYYSGQRKGVSLAKLMLGENISWAQTYNITAGTENVYQKFKTCPVGKVINLETGNCVSEVQPVVTLAACPEGKYRNPLTGRCKSYATTASTALKPCAEGYERNPETNRCRKIVTNSGADYPVVMGEVEEKKELASIYAIVTIVAAGLIYIAFQYKEEIKLKFSNNQKPAVE